MTRYTSNRCAAALAATFSILLAACGGGSEAPGTQTPPNDPLSVVPGDPTFTPPYGDAGGDGGGGGSAGAGDGGPGLGKFRNALVRVELADGRVAGEAEVDPVRGVVHVRIGSYTGPVRFTARGKADGSTTYFDEAAGKFVPYPPGSEINAVVPRFDKNVGITILTESAWRYLATKYGADGWKDAAKVTEANQRIRDDFNQYVPQNFRISDITRLPYLLSDDTANGAIPDNENGRYGVVISGLGVAAGLFRPGDPAPVLRLADQMPRDYCDGSLDEACNGVPVVANPADAAYTVAQLSGNLDNGVGRIADRYLSTPPSITTQPTDVQAVAGQAVAFSVVAAGTQPLSYQWLRNGAPIAGANADRYSLTTTLADDGATFSVVVSNTIGTITSPAALLSVTPAPVPPTITRQPRSITVAEDLSATFAVSATGTAPLQYQWSRNGTPLAGATTATYTTPLTTPADDAAAFTVSVSNAAGPITSDPATLTVHQQNPLCATATGGGWCWRNPLPQGNSLAGLAYADPSTPIVVGDLGTILRSGDGGATWAAAASRGNGLLSVDFAAGKLGVAVGLQGTIMRTVDSGASWSAVGFGFSSTFRRVRFLTTAVVVAVGDGGTIVRSSDSGATWARVTGVNATLSGLSFADATTGVAVGSNGTIVRTTDAGLSWNPVPSGTTAALSGVHFSSPTNAIAVGAAGTLLQTVDAGATWRGVASSTTRTLDDVHCANASTCVAIGGDLVLRTSDGGATWAVVSAGARDLAAVRFANDMDGMAIGTRGEMLRTNDGGATWSAESRGLASSLLDVAFADAAIGFAVGDAGTILRTGDGGATWQPLAIGRTDNLRGVGAAGATGLAVGMAGTILRTLDGGKSWTPIGQTTANHLNDVAFADNAIAVAVGDAGTILRTLDGGANWSLVTSPVASQLNRVAFVGGKVGLAVGAGGAILITMDAGGTWRPVQSGTTTDLFGVAFTGGTTVATAVGAGGVALRSDGGTAWTSVPTGVQTALLAVHFADAENGLAVGASGTTLSTKNGGASWTPIASSISTNLSTVQMLSATNGVAAGQLGTLLLTTSAAQ